MTENQNPVGRLYEILTAAHGTNAMNVQRGWALVFNIPAEDIPSLLKAIAGLDELSQRAETIIKNVDDIDHEAYLQYFPNISKAIRTSFSLTNEWNTVRKFLDDATLNNLRLCVDITKDVIKIFIDQDTLSEIQSKVEELLEQVLSSDIPQDIKQKIIEHLQHIHDAVVNYRLSGPEGLEEATERYLGFLFLHYDVLRKTKFNDYFDSHWDLIKFLVEVLGIGIGALQLLGPAITNLLGAGS